MVKFPSQRKMLYATGDISNDAWTIIASGNISGSGSVSGPLNLPKDLSLLNRRGYASTTNKGVPLVYRCKVDFYPQDEDGFGPGTAMGSDFQATLQIAGCQNNWVFRNAAVKWHAARDNMWKKAGIKKSQLGTYANAIRYGWDSSSEAFLKPLDAYGEGFVGGTWDTTTMVDMVDNEYKLALTCDGVDEDSAHSVGVVNIAHAYLSSRSTVPLDSNEESSEVPAQFSHLEQLLRPTNLESGTEESYIRTDVVNDQDNPPYEVFATESLNHDITEPVELGRCIAGTGTAYGSAIVDIPFGIAGLRATVYNAADTNITPNFSVGVEVLDIFEMQG